MYGHSILSKILLLSADIAKKAMICKKQFQFFPLNRNPQKPNSGCLGCQVHPSTRISRGQTYLPLQTKLSSSADISCTLILCCIFLRHLSFHNTHTKLSYLLTPPIISHYTYQALIASQVLFKQQTKNTAKIKTFNIKLQFKYMLNYSLVWYKENGATEICVCIVKAAVTFELVII